MWPLLMVPRSRLRTSITPGSSASPGCSSHRLSEFPSVLLFLLVSCGPLFLNRAHSQTAVVLLILRKGPVSLAAGEKVRCTCLHLSSAPFLSPSACSARSIAFSLSSFSICIFFLMASIFHSGCGLGTRRSVLGYPDGEAPVCDWD